MDKNEEIIYENLSDGILLVELDGKIRLVNQSAAEILGMETAELKGKKLVRLMMEHEGNDEFFQCILDAVYSKQKSNDIVRYHLGSEEKRLRVVSSLLPPGGGGMEKGGLAVLLSDLTKIITLSEKNEELNRRLSGFIDRFVQVMIGAVEARTPYNANHTKNMVRYGTRFLDWWCIQPGQSFPEEMRTPVLASIWLHDIGKLIVPRSIMDKPTRLGNSYEDVMHRITVAILCEELREQKEGPSEEIKEHIEALREASEKVKTLNEASFLDAEALKSVEELARLQCLTPEGNYVPLLDDYEREALSIARGTLTAKERQCVQSHVVHTREMLERMGYTNEYAHVSEWAGNHHEYLDGSGYPKGLKGDEISWETRLLTILDIYDSLTADDRPYKPAMASEKAFSILRQMAAEGKLDEKLVEQFYVSGAWKNEK